MDLPQSTRLGALIPMDNILGRHMLQVIAMETLQP
jgi:phospholipid N-methyltransferase